MNLVFKIFNLKNRCIGTYCLMALTLFSACRDKYLPELRKQPNGYLVVQGFINVGTGPTNIQLTHATGLDSPFILYETGAQVEVQAARWCQLSAH